MGERALGAGRGASSVGNAGNVLQARARPQAGQLFNPANPGEAECACVCASCCRLGCVTSWARC